MKKTLVALCWVMAAACGGDDPSGVELITVADGATIALSDGTVIEIPANAVAADIEVTVSHAALTEFAPLAEGRDQVLVFEPYVALSAPATVTIDVGEPAPSPSDYASVYQFGDGVWIGLDTSTVIDADGRIHSAIPALGPTAVRIMVGQPPS